MNRTLAVTAAAVSLILVSGALAQPSVGFHYIGVLGGQGQEISTPTAIAPDGTVYGPNDYFRNNGNFRRAWIWTQPTGMDPLASTPASGTSSGAYAVSADGSVLVGVLGIAPGSSGPGAQVFRRVNAGANEVLPLDSAMFYPQVSAISDNGHIVIGTVNGYGGGGRAVTWADTSTAAMLPNLAGAASSQALGVNADGSVIVGWSGQGYPFDNTPCRWVNGQVESLGLPPECDWAWARGVSGDGKTIVGLGWVRGGSSRAWMWTQASGMQLLDAGPGGFAEALSISADGRFVGGRTATESVVWRDGVRFSVPAQLIPAATSFSPFLSLTGPVIISRNAKFVAGSERVSEGAGDAEYHAWMAALPADFTAPLACAADLDDDGNFANGLTPDGGVDINDLLAFLGAFEAGDAGVDLDDDGLDPRQPDGGVDINDLIFMLAHFEAGC